MSTEPTSSAGTIVVLGFGRSGTTWVADVISKALGELVLFEPLHPSVFELSRRFAYTSADSQEDVRILKGFFADVLEGRQHSPWLLRNHIPVPLHEVSPRFLETVWSECTIVGFKEIRANFMVRWFHESLGARVVFMLRDPLAVVASILRRPNFWGEYGWPDHYRMFLARTLDSEPYARHPIQACRRLVQGVDRDIERIAVMWAITHAIALPILDDLGVPVFSYESMYRAPFVEARRLLTYLGYPSRSVHPAHVFTPSMTTHRTLHGLLEKEPDLDEQGATFFWREVLSASDASSILAIADAFGVPVSYSPETSTAPANEP